MIEQLMTLAMNNGLIAALFTGLLIYVLRDTAARERKYQEMIDELHEDLKIVHEIREKVIEIKKDIEGGK
jgi:hypothetical protein